MIPSRKSLKKTHRSRYRFSEVPNLANSQRVTLSAALPAQPRGSTNSLGNSPLTPADHERLGQATQPGCETRKALEEDEEEQC